MRQTVTNTSTKLLRNILRLEFQVAQTKTNRSKVHHLETKSEAALLRTSLEELTATVGSSSRLLAVYDRSCFKKRLQSIEQSFKVQKNSQFSFLLNRTVMPRMLPAKSLVAAMTLNAIQRALTVTSPEKILLANPFKDPEQVQLAFSRGVESMVVSSMEEIQAILENSQRDDRQLPHLVWQFDEANIKEATVSLLLSRALGLNLAGIKFIEKTVAQPKFIAEVLSIARSSGHQIKTVYVEASHTQPKLLQSTLKSLSSENVNIELTDVDSRADLLCAAQVIANRDNRLHFNDVAEEYMSKQTRFLANKYFSGAKTGDWITFTPSHVLGLEEQADKVSEVHNNFTDINSGSFKELAA